MEKLLTPPEVAELLSLKLSTVYSLVASGRLPCVRIGGRIRFDPDDLLRWVAARKEGG